MRCARCGNEVSQDEVFCGQCGAPNTAAGQPASGVGPLAPATRSGQFTTQGTNAAAYNPTMQAPPAGSFVQRQSNEFYHDATEAMIIPPGGIYPGQPSAYPPQPFAGTPATNSMPQGQYIPAPHLSRPGNYGAPLYSQQPLLPAVQYEAPPQRSGGAIAIMVSICVVVVLISIGGLAALYFAKSQPTTPSTVANSTELPTTAPTPTLAPTPSPTPLPSPTATTNSVADPGFTLCDQACTANGFITEYPMNWQSRTLTRTSGVQFSNPDQTDQHATFKAPGTANDTASNIALADLQQNFSKKSGYTTDMTTSPTPIGGEMGVSSTAFYQSNGQRERVVVYAVVHQGQAYIIELQASDDQFENVNQQFFTFMLGKFQFQQSTPAQ